MPDCFRVIGVEGRGRKERQPPEAETSSAFRGGGGERKTQKTGPNMARRAIS
ncbi:hypothetical protein B4135_0255 [Caldibacillus debilis]|uniref:Uncharacterized protein n=1 Tax=Caldibacillus debilis TaxID=301148 RepID=A0A150M8F6_9BACI|nr:hypothetical protein B4135_0255 [Caldibacillus debilis]